MAYEPTVWKSGDTVTSAKLNKMEQGIANAGGGGGILILHDVDGTLDKTWQEIHDAAPSVLLTYEEDGMTKFLPLFAVGHQEVYVVSFADASSPHPLGYFATSADGYPVYDE